MKVGIKVGPQPQSLADLAATDPQMCEVWYNVSRSDEYADLFAAIKAKHIETGLHYWGALPDGTWTNLAYPDQELISQSMAMMKRCVDTAAANGFRYVNIHPGSRAKVRIDFSTEKFGLLSEPAPVETSVRLFLEQATELSAYARSKGILLTVETVPKRVMNGWQGQTSRRQPFDVYELPIAAITTAGKSGIAVANDFGHTAANCLRENRDEVWRYLLESTRQLAPYTHLIHAAFLIPPFNGTDFHDSLDNPLFDTDQAVPNRREILELLRIFSGRDDVWILVEPSRDHQRNFQILKTLVSDAVKTP